MATSNSFSYTETVMTAVNDAADILGFVDDTNPLLASEFNRFVRQLNRINKSIQMKNTQGAGMHVWQRRVGYMFLSANTGTYVLSSNSPYWTENFLSTTSALINVPGATTINVGSTINLLQANDSANLTSANVANGYQMVVQLDNGTMFYSTANVVNNTKVSIPAPGLPSSCNNALNFIYFFATSAQPPQVIDNINLRIPTGTDLTLEKLTYDQYNALPAKAQQGFTGDPQAFYYESHLVGSSKFGYLFTDVNGVADLTKYLVIQYVREIQDCVNPTDELDCPQEFYNALIWTLAKEMAPTYSVAWTDAMEDNYKRAVKLASNSNFKRTAMKFVRRSNRGTFNSPPHR